MAGLIPVPIIQKEAWAQCENPNCEKWRKLPPGTVVDENEPWYCYLNPDHDRNRCSASEVEYDENNEFVIAGDADPEEAARNARIMEELEASIAAAALAARGRGRGGRARGGRGRSRGRGRPPLSGRGVGGAVGIGGFGAPQALYGFGGGGGMPAAAGIGNLRQRSVSFAEDYDDFGDFDSTGQGRGGGSKLNKKQVVKHLQRLLENQGQWEALRANTAVGTLPPLLPSDAWEAIGLAGPELAELACSAADISSSMRYFEGPASGQQAAMDAGVLARLTAMLAAASGLVQTGDALSTAEREKLGLDGGVDMLDVAPPVEQPQPAEVQTQQIEMLHTEQQQPVAVAEAEAVGDGQLMDGTGEPIPPQP